jgi:flagellum-specific peptidoglycan hydrolase FlgJ
MSTLDKVAALALATEKSTGIPKEVTAAQAILEAGWNLESAPGNNAFGIKAGEGIGSGKQLLRTREWFDPAELRQFLAGPFGRTAQPAVPIQVNSSGRTLYQVRDFFAVFPTLDACFDYRARLLLASPIYRDATAKFKAIAHPTPADVSAYIDAIAKRYATDEEYADKVKKIAFGAALTRAFEGMAA